MPDELDRDFGMPVGLALAGILVLVAALVILLPQRHSTEKAPDIRGCYSSPHLPDIMIGNGVLTVAENRPVTVHYKLEYHKGWTLVLHDGLQLAPSGGSQGVEVRRGRAQFLFFSKELEISPPGLRFYLSDLANRRSAEYVRKGNACISH